MFVFFFFQGVTASVTNFLSFVWCYLLLLVVVASLSATPVEAQSYDQYYYNYHDQYHDPYLVEEEQEEDESWFPSFFRWWVQPRRLWSRARSIVPRIADVAVESASAVVLPGLAVLALAMLWPEHKYIRSKRDSGDGRCSTLGRCPLLHCGKTLTVLVRY